MGRASPHVGPLVGRLCELWTCPAGRSLVESNRSACWRAPPAAHLVSTDKPKRATASPEHLHNRSLPTCIPTRTQLATKGLAGLTASFISGPRKISLGLEYTRGTALSALVHMETSFPHPIRSYIFPPPGTERCFAAVVRRSRNSCPSQPANLPGCQPQPCKLSGRPGLHRHLRSPGVTLGPKTDASMPSRSTGPKTRHGSASRTRKSSTDTLQWACNGGYRDSQVPRRIKTSKRSKGSAVRRLAPAQPMMAPYLRGNRGG